MAITQEKRVKILERALEEYLEDTNLSSVQIRRDLGKLSHKTGIDFNDLCEVFSPIVEKILKDAFLLKKLSSIPHASKYTTTFPKK